jgi:hypothetical protein
MNVEPLPAEFPAGVIVLQHHRPSTAASSRRSWLGAAGSPSATLATAKPSPPGLCWSCHPPTAAPRVG